MSTVIGFVEREMNECNLLTLNTWLLHHYDIITKQR